MIRAQDFMSAIMLVVLAAVLGSTIYTYYYVENNYVENKKETEIIECQIDDENIKVLTQIDSLIEILKNPPIK